MHDKCKLNEENIEEIKNELGVPEDLQSEITVSDVIKHLQIIKNFTMFETPELLSILMDYESRLEKTLYLQLLSAKTVQKKLDSYITKR